MAEILGGEVGEESWSPAIQAEYERLRNRAYSRRSYDRTGHTPAPAAREPEPTRFPDLGEAFQDRKRTPERSSRIEETPYSDRVRMDLIASRPQHGIKTRRSAIASFFAFLVDVPDFVSPRFILEFDAQVGNHLDSLVLAVRTLADKSKKQLYHSLRKDALSFRVLNVIRDWDIEGLHRDLTYLQSRPRRLPISDCDELARRLYAPILRLEYLEPLYHVSRAIQFAYQQHVQTLPKTSPEIGRLRRNLSAAQQEVGVVFSVVKRRCYPLLMKLASTRCLDHGSYFSEEHDSILQFLGLEESELLKPRQQPETPILDRLPGAGEEVESEAGESEGTPGEVASESSKGRLAAGAMQRGLALLDRLFPQAGWLRLEQYPDFYAYFQPILSFPRGYELLPPSDVLNPVVVLIAILRELFYAYRDIRFGALRDDDGQMIDLGEIMDELLDSWHRYLEDIIGGEYVQRLVEYCRHVERHPDFQSSRYAKRLEAELAWIKAKHLVQWERLISARGLRIPGSKGLPALFDRVGELRDFLTRVALDIDRAKKEGGETDSPGALPRCSTIENPWSEPDFPVRTSVSRRVMSVLPDNRHRKTSTNADLIYATVSIVYVLSYLLEDGANPYATADSAGGPYRGIDGRGGEPAYVVDVRPTIEILASAEMKEAEEQNSNVATLVARDEVTGMQNTVSLRESLRAAIARYDREKVTFTVVGVAIRGFDAYRREVGPDSADALLERFAVCVEGCIDQDTSTAFRLEQDKFLLLLSGADDVAGAATARELFRSCLSQDPTNLQLSLAVIPFYRTWGPERVLKSTFRALELAEGHPYPTCLVYKPVKGTYEIMDLLEDAEEE